MNAHLEVVPRIIDDTIAASYKPTTNLQIPKDSTPAKVIQEHTNPNNIPNAPLTVTQKFFTTLSDYSIPILFSIFVFIIIYVVWKYWTTYRNPKQQMNNNESLIVNPNQNTDNDPPDVANDHSHDLSKYIIGSDEGSDDEEDEDANEDEEDDEEDEESDEDEEDEDANEDEEDDEEDEESDEDDEDDGEDEEEKEESDDEESDDEEEDEEEEDEDEETNHASSFVMPDMAMISELINQPITDDDMLSSLNKHHPRVEIIEEIPLIEDTHNDVANDYEDSLFTLSAIPEETNATDVPELEPIPQAAPVVAQKPKRAPKRSKRIISM
jgi:flagellar biosynthesis GTPase FlhF